MQMGSVFMHTLPKIRLVNTLKAAPAIAVTAVTAVTAAFYNCSKPHVYMFVCRLLHATHTAYTAFEHMW